MAKAKPKPRPDKPKFDDRKYLSEVKAKLIPMPANPKFDDREYLSGVKPKLIPMPANPKLLSLAQVAADLGVHPVTIWRWVRAMEGFPEPVRVGLSKIAFYEHEINEFKRNRARRSSAPLPPKKRRIDSVKRVHQSA